MDLIKMLCSLELAELMYRRLPKDAVHTKQSPIVMRYCSSTGEIADKKLTAALTK